MRAHTLTRVALLAMAVGVAACGAQNPGQGHGRWQTAGNLPPASGLADYNHVTGSGAGSVVPLARAKPDWHQDGDGGRGRDWGKGGWDHGNDWGAPWSGGWGWCPPFPLYGPSLPYFPPIMVWGPYSPMPLLDVPGIPVGPVAPFFDPFGFGWAW